MTTLEILNSLIEQLPYKNQESKSFKDNLKSAEESFFDIFDKVEENDLKLFFPEKDNHSKKIIRNRIKTVYAKLNVAINYYYEGKPAKAYDEIKKLLQNVSVIRGLSDAYQGFLSNNFGFYKENNLFRMRSIDPNETTNPTRKNIFHLAFENRGKASTARFSIPGFPCIYLGTSAKTCWLEIGKSENNIYVSRFVVNNSDFSLIPINLSIPEYFTEEIYDKEAYMNRDAFCFLLTFPLIQSCTFKIHDESKEHKFKTEYIIPQLLMQYTSEENDKFNSIIYSSTKAESNTKQSVNIVIPVQTIKDFGFCPKLEKSIKLTKPLLLSKFDDTDFDSIEKNLLEMETKSVE